MDSVERGKSDVATLVELNVKALVDHPGEVTVTEVEGQASTIIEVRTHHRDYGKVVGRHGDTIDAIRHLLRNIGAKHHRRYIIEIEDPKVDRFTIEE